MATRRSIEAKHHIPVQPHHAKVEAYHDRLDSADHMTKSGGGTETHKGMGSGETTMKDKSAPLADEMGKFGGVMSGPVDSGD